jgi:hypothetical protein
MDFSLGSLQKANRRGELEILASRLNYAPDAAFGAR